MNGFAQRIPADHQRRLRRVHPISQITQPGKRVLVPVDLAVLEQAEQANGIAVRAEALS